MPTFPSPPVGLSQESLDTLALRDDVLLKTVANQPAWARPGDAPEIYGLGNVSQTEVPSNLIFADEFGRIVRLSGNITLAPRLMMPVESGRVYLARFVFQRRTNTTDPANDAVRLGIAFFDAYENYIQESIFETITTLTVASGRQTRKFFYAREDGATVNTIAPAAARYARPFIRVFGPQPRTDVEVLGCLDITDLVPPGPQGPKGSDGPIGPRGWRGLQGEKGDPGNYLGIDLIGASDDIADRPASAIEGQAWGLTGDGVIRIYVWTGGAWFDAGPITSPEAIPVANMIYVAESGDDANNGSTLSTAVLSIERALELAEARGGEVTLIDWYPGEYETQGHLDVPDNCVIRAPHRGVFVRPSPGYEVRNVFRLGSGCFLEGPIFEGWRVDSLADPTEGFAVSFRPGAVIRRVPYAHKIAVRTPPTWGLVPPPLDRVNGNPLVGNGGGVVLADGLVCSQYSTFANIMTWGATPVSHNGIGYCAKNGGLINAVNAVSMWAHRHFYAKAGGQIVLSSCSTQFGDWTMHADGGRDIVMPATPASTIAPAPDDAALITPARVTMIDATWAALVSGGYTAGWTADDETYTRSDATLWLQVVEWCLASGDPTPMENFARGLFNAIGDPVFSADKLAAFVFSFEDLRDRINALGLTAASQTAVSALTTALTDTLSSPVKRFEPSLITAIGHTWQNNLAGVALTKIPPAIDSAPILDSILETDRGVVIATGQAQDGSALLARSESGELVVDPDLGLSGSLFDTAVQQRALAASIMGSF